MFTGIVEEIGTLRRLERRGPAAKLELAATLAPAGAALGDSIAVNGACLTVTGLGEGWFTVDLSPETLGRTNLGHLRPGAPVNLERSLAVGGRLGGHFVQGHVDAVGRVRALGNGGPDKVITFAAPPAVMRYVVVKGFIAVDGMSLTVVERWEDGFSVAFIPYTLAHTVAGGYRVGALVNLEADILGKYVERLLADRKSETPSGASFWARHGYTD